MALQFSKDGKYFAKLSTNGKLKIWETSTSSLLQEFTPDFHLTTPCTCLQFIQQELLENHIPRKKKRKNSLGSPVIALGTTAGKLLVYSIGKGDLDFTIDSNTPLPISCVSWCDGSILYSAVDQNIVKWNLEKKCVKSKWKLGNELITSILALPDNKLMVGAKTLKLCNTLTQEVLRTFTGHSHDVIFLRYLNPSSSDSDAYVISGSKGDRLLSVWNISEGSDEKSGVANFLMDDIPVCVSSLCSSGTSNVVAVTHSGTAHFYRHTLNGKCKKPLKPRTKLQVATQPNQKQAVSLIPIIGAHLNDDLSLLLCYGNEILLTFENVDINDNEKLQTLVRVDPNSTRSGDKAVTKTQTPIIDNNVHYLTPHTSSTFKRKSDGRREVPMEIRLENLTLNKLDSKSKTSRVNNVAQLLIQGLHSKNKAILASVLNGDHGDTVIKDTIKRLPVPVLLPLIEELTSLIQGTTVPSQYGSLWLKHLLEVHAGIFLSNPDLPNLLGPVLGSIESRLSLLMPLNRLKGRLDLLVSQVSNVNASDENVEDNALLIYNDKGLSDSESEIIDFAPQSESENEWNEDSDHDSNEQVDESDNDIEML